MIYAAISIFSPLYTHLVLPFYKPKVNLTESIESPTTKREKEKRFSFFFDLLLLGLFLISIFITCITILPSVASLEYSKASLLIKSTPPDLYRYLSNKAQMCIRDSYCKKHTTPHWQGWRHIENHLMF